MMFRGHRPIFGCIDHGSLPRKLPSPGWRRSERGGTLKGVPSKKFGNGKPERFALAFRGGLSLHLHGNKVERPCPAPDLKSNSAFWRAKVRGNRERDARHIETLQAAGWTVVTVWECELARPARLIG